MKTRNSVRVHTIVATVMLAALLGPMPPPLSAARASEPLAGVEVAAGLVTFQPQLSYSQVRVTVTGPGGFEAVETFGGGETPAVELPGIDGLYKYELRFSPVLDQEARELLARARESGIDLGGDKTADKRTVQRGWFSLADGRVVPDFVELEPKVVLTNGDGVIRNSLCVGFDCPDSPVFDDSTILLMENNTRLKFGDTSAAPFPNNDWEIEANSSLSGGANYLGFNDCGTAADDGGCATDLVFAVESGVRQSALYVERDGDIGIGTSTPVLDLHIVTGNSPALRLDQDGSSGFASQVWDIAGNEVNFFVRDVTAGSRLPFRIRPGAPSSAIDVAASGDVGIGTASPQEELHVVRSDAGPTRIRVENTTTGLVGFNFTNALEEWRVVNDGRFILNAVSGAGNEFIFEANGTLRILGGLITSGGGGACTVGDPCDGVFHPDFVVPSIEEHAAAMWENSYLPAVGPTLPNQPINLTGMATGMLNELEKAHIYIERLNLTVKDLNLTIQHLEARLEMLEAKVSE